MARWRIILLLSVLVVSGLLMIFRPPARLGPAGSAVAGGIGLGLVGMAVIRRGAILRVFVAVIAAGTGVAGGFVVWYLDRNPGQSALDSAIPAVVPSGFKEEPGSREGCDGPLFGCSTYASRVYAGPGTVATATEQLLVKMRRACYTDAAPLRAEPSPDGSPVAVGVQIGGTCVRKDIDLAASLTARGSDVVIRVSAYPR